ncbi:MAG: hypothetical protein R3301_18480, partial [Saprospiraceae bacterium]|nr:hypothetical protein [Saprospiraceae bacterium]
MKSLKHLIALPLTCTLLLTITSLHAQRIGIGTTNPDPSAILEITSDSLGVLIPRMTAAERDAIMNPATGLMVFVTNDSSFYCFEGSAWQMVGGRGYMLVDADGDTKIQVEESPDEDILRIDLGGTEYFRMDNGRIHVLNTGNSVFLGDSAGISDDLDANKNVFIGHAAGQNSETGFLNVGIGHNSFYNNTTGGRNVATGAGSLFNNTSGFYNVASGQAALYNNTSGNGNVASGYHALVGNTTGQHNVGLGYLSLKLNTVGIGNIAVGAEAGFNALDTGSIFLGYRAGYFETAGNRLYIENSTADSANALIYGEFDNDWLRINGHLTATMGLSDADHDTKIQVEEGADDDTIRFDIQGTEYYRMEEGRIHVGNTGRTVLIGRAAGSSQNLGSLDNTDNTFVGDSTGTGISLGNYNTAMGSKALSGGGGFHNVAIGFAALRSYSGFGGFNTALGTRAGYNATGRYNVFLGHEAGYHETKDSTLYISSTDADSANALIYGEFDNKWLRVNGYLTPALGLSDADHDTKIQVEKDPDDDKIRFETNGTEFFRMTDGRLEILNSGGSVRIGEGAGGNVSAADLEDKITANVFIGRNAGANHDTTGNKLVGIGGDALRFNENGDYNVAIGYRSMYANIGGHSNVALGLHTLYSNTNGKYNIAVGMKALEQSQSAEANTAVGYEALQSHTSGNSNTAVGYRALWEDTGGTQNTAIGREAIYKNNSSENNTGVGYRALYNNGNGNRNTGIGRNALHDNTNGDENTALG